MSSPARGQGDASLTPDGAALAVPEASPRLRLYQVLEAMGLNGRETRLWYALNLQLECRATKIDDWPDLGLWLELESKFTDHVLCLLRRGEWEAEGVRTGQIVPERLPAAWWERAKATDLHLFKETVEWNGARFAGLRLRPAVPDGTLAAAAPEQGQPLGTSEMPRNRGGRPTTWDWAAFDREMLRIANTPDGLPGRDALTRHMRDWTMREWGDCPSDSQVRKHIAERYPG